MLLCKVVLSFLGSVCGHLSWWGYVTKVWFFVYKNMLETLKQMKCWNCRFFGFVKGMLLKVEKVLMLLGFTNRMLFGVAQ